MICSFLIFFYSVLRFTSLSSFFTHIETNQSVGGAKTGVPGEKPPDTPASRTWLVPHVTRAPSEARTHSDDFFNIDSLQVVLYIYTHQHSLILDGSLCSPIGYKRSPFPASDICSKQKELSINF